eukprot:6189277-Pleurochrysis_carterae.AAC.1
MEHDCVCEKREGGRGGKKRMRWRHGRKRRWTDLLSRFEKLRTGLGHQMGLCTPPFYSPFSARNSANCEKLSLIHI